MCTSRAPASAMFRMFAWVLGFGAGAFAGSASAVDVAASPLLAIDQNRSTVVDRIVADWGDALAAAKVGLSREQLRTMLAAMRADHLLAASLAGSLDGLRNVIAQAITSSTPAATDMFESKSLGDTSGDLVYTPITPCRLVETRGSFAAVYQGDGTPAHTPSPFASNQIRSYAAQGGNGVCLSQLPAGLTPSALQLQVFGIPVGGASGDIEILPQGSAFGSTATLIYLGSIPFTSASSTARLNLANNQIAVQVRGGGAHVAIDVLGYFKAPGAPIGTVSNIATGTGLTGGPITTTGTISIANGGVGTTQLAAKAVTQAKLSPAATPTPGQVLGSDGTNLQWQTVGGGGGVSSVTASAPLASSGGSTPNISMTGGAAGQVLIWNAGVPQWNNSAVLAGNLYVNGGSLLSPNVGIGGNDPQAIVHIEQFTNQAPPRVESHGTAGFGAGWDFYLNGVAKGFVGVPDPSAVPGGGELMLYGGSLTTTSLWGGTARAVTISNSGDGNVGIGTGPGNLTKLTVVGGASTGVVANGLVNGLVAHGVDIGVYGESDAASLTKAGVYGRNTASGGIGVTGVANVGSATGVFGTSSSGTGFGMYAQNTGGGRALFVDGPGTQGSPYGGLVKAMLHIGVAGNIGACYNGVTGSSTIPCGYSVTHPGTGQYTINLGFSMAGRFPLFQSNLLAPSHVLITGYPANGISVQTVYSGGSAVDGDFYVVVF